MKAFLKNYRQSPRKVSLVAKLIKGKSVLEAQQQLKFLNKRASLPILKLLNSAVANAQNNFKLNPENLYIKEIKVNKGIVLKRWMPRAFGRASRILKRCSHISILLDKIKK